MTCKTEGPLSFTSLLFDQSPGEATVEPQEEPPYASDLNLDQIVKAMADGQEEHELIVALLYQQLNEVGAVYYRHEVFRDLTDRRLFECIQHFVEQLRQVRAHLAQLEKMHYQYQREGWYLDAAAIYCDAVRTLAGDFASAHLDSRALVGFREFLTGYVASSAFGSLAADTSAQKEALSQIRYCIRIDGDRVEVSRYEGQADYSTEVLETFERFKQGAVKDYLVKYRVWPGMNHVGGQILQLLARLFNEEFSALDQYCLQHQGFFDHTVRRFEREVQFYLAYIGYIAPLRAAGLTFCYPEVSKASKEVVATDTFDLALAKKLVSERKPVVRNDFYMKGAERIFVVSGPNQGGKSTFARTFGQLHHLARIGCPVPGGAARFFLCDQIFTHFEREEDLSKMSGKLEDDLVRIGAVLRAATPSDIIIMNELFTSTTLNDARFLGKKVLEKIVQVDLLAVYITFVDELACLGDSVVSMVSTIVPENPAERTFKVVRAPADGLAYAQAIAEKHNVTYDRLRVRLAP
ncbi:MAG: MutS-related protein [Acidimicrobiales bacterium]